MWHRDIAWPARSPDPTPLDFFFWGYVKDRIYKTDVNGIDHLMEKNHYIYEPISIIPPANERYWMIQQYYIAYLLYLCPWRHTMTSSNHWKFKFGYDVTKSVIWVVSHFFLVKSTPRDGHFEVLIIQFGSETKKIYTKTYFDNASITRRDFRFRRFL